MVKESIASGQLGEALLSHSQRSNETHGRRKRMHGVVIDTGNLQILKEKRDLFYILSFMVHNTKPVGHQVILIFPYSILQTSESRSLNWSMILI